MNNSLAVKSTTEVFNLKNVDECVKFTKKYFMDSSLVTSPLYDLFQKFGLLKLINFETIESVALDRAIACSVKVIHVEGLEGPNLIFNCRGVTVEDKMINANLAYTCYDNENCISINGLAYNDVDKYADRLVEGFRNPGFSGMRIAYGKLDLYAVRCDVICK